MGGRKLRVPLPLGQVVLILLTVLVVYLAVDFGRQVIISHQRRVELREVEKKAQEAEEKRAALDKRLLYVQSPEAAEAWAREQGWVQADEVPVVLVAPKQESASGAQEVNQDGAESPSYRDMWLDLFFGER